MNPLIATVVRRSRTALADAALVAAGCFGGMRGRRVRVTRRAASVA